MDAPKFHGRSRRCTEKLTDRVTVRISVRVRVRIRVSFRVRKLTKFDVKSHGYTESSWKFPWAHGKYTEVDERPADAWKVDR